MNLQQLVTNPRFPQFAMSLSRRMPREVAYPLARLIANAIALAKPEIYWVVRANLSQVLGMSVDRDALNDKTRQVFYYAMRNNYDLFRALRLAPTQRNAAVDFPEPAQAVARAALASGRGAVLVLPHLGNFDLILQALGTYAPAIQILSLPNPPAAFRHMNNIRALSGVAVTPLSPAALRQALRLLKRGGVVGIAGDRPVSELDEPFPFFGRPARVPSGHVRLALKTEALIVVGYCAFVPETRRYMLDLHPPLEMIHSDDPDEEVALNMRRVLDLLEDAIRRWAEQWQIFVPVWPELLEGRT